MFTESYGPLFKVAPGLSKFFEAVSLSSSIGLVRYSVPSGVIPCSSGFLIPRSRVVLVSQVFIEQRFGRFISYVLHVKPFLPPYDLLFLSF